ncbi:MAG: SPOR domain-containing protein [Sphingomonadaceae bacterium]
MVRFARLLFASAAACLLAAPAPADVEDGIAAWQRGDYAAAVREWRPLAERGNADAQFNLAQAYRLGRGVTADVKEAERWYLAAARQDHEQAEGQIGLLMFQNGRRAEAMPWVEKAAMRGDPRAQYVLGTAHFNGDLAPRDWPRAFALMSLASAQGLPPAASSLAEMEKHLSTDERLRGLEIARQMEGSSRVARADLPRSKPAIPTWPQPSAPEKVSEVPVPAPKAAPPPSATVPKPVARPATEAAPSPASGWRVQLGAFSQQGNARRLWDRLGSSSLLAGLSPMYVRNGGLTKLQAGPLASRAAAERLCASLKASGQGCFPISP